MGQARETTLSQFVTSKDKATLNSCEPDKEWGSCFLAKVLSPNVDGESCLRLHKDNMSVHIRPVRSGPVRDFSKAIHDIEINTRVCSLDTVQPCHQPRPTVFNATVG